MQRGRRAIEADIGDEIAALGLFIEAGEVGALMQKAALGSARRENRMSDGKLRTRNPAQLRKRADPNPQVCHVKSTASFSQREKVVGYRASLATPAASDGLFADRMRGYSLRRQEA